MVQQIEIKKLKLLDRNPRTITRAQMEKCKESLSRSPEFLQVRPILVNLVDDVYYVYAGNMRVRAAKKLGWKFITCAVEPDLSHDEIQMRIIMDNAHFGEHDYEILACDFDVQLLLDCGHTEQSLQISADRYDAPDEETDKEKSVKMCPHCGLQV